MKKTLLALMILVIIGIAAAQFEDFTNDLRNEKIEEPAKKAPDPLAEMLNNEITEKLNEASKQDIASNEINDIFERKLNDQLTEKQDKTSTTVKEQNTTSKQTPKTELKETSPLQDKLNQLIDTELTNEPSNQENKEIEAGKINKPIQNQPDETIYDALDEKIKKLGDEAEITIDGISLEKKIAASPCFVNHASALSRSLWRTRIYLPYFSTNGLPPNLPAQ